MHDQSLGIGLSRAFHRICPDPLVIAILLTALTAVIAVASSPFPLTKPC